MSSLSYVELGGTLFIPASHKDLNIIVNEGKYKELKSLVIDFEDGLDEALLFESMEQLKRVLSKIDGKNPFIFLRARDTQHLKRLLRVENIKKITGFVLAKFSLENADEYFEILKDSNFCIMPSIEGEELFNQQKLLQLREKIITNKQKVVLVRFGLEDMLRQLGMRRECSESVFDLSAPSYVIGNFIATFKSVGFSVSGGVYPCFKDKDGFQRDVKRDMREGLFSKTLIHPDQVSQINELYKVTQKEYDEALELIESQKVVFAQNGKMAEVPTMKQYSLEIILRAKEYGIRT